MLNDDTSTTAPISDTAPQTCVCGTAGCGGSCVGQQDAEPLVPVFKTDSVVCTCARFDPIAAAHEAFQAENNDVAIEPDTTLSSQTDDQQVMYSAGTTSTSTTLQSTQAFIQVQPIPDLPNPNPDGFTNTAFIPNADRITFVADSGNRSSTPWPFPMRGKATSLPILSIFRISTITALPILMKAGCAISTPVCWPM